MSLLSLSLSFSLSLFLSWIRDRLIVSISQILRIFKADEDIQLFFFNTEFFNSIEILNKDKLYGTLCVIDFYRKVVAVMFSLEASRDSKFGVVWPKALDGINDLDSRDTELHDNAKFRRD